MTDLVTSRRSPSSAVKVAAILGGYLCAFAIASAAVSIRIAHTSGPVAQASSGMYAFGDSVLFLTVFGTIAMIPTMAALWLLRPHERVWRTLSILGLCIAGTGPLAVALFVAGRTAPQGSQLGLWGALSVLRLLPAPLITPAFAIFGLLAPNRSSRLLLLTAAAVECVGAVFAFLQWFSAVLFSS